MSDDQSATPASEDESSAGSPPTAKPKPKTSLFGRIVIGILLVVLAVEGYSFYGWNSAKSKLSDELAKAESDGINVTYAKANQILGNRDPDVSKKIKVAAGEEKYDVYYFPGLIKKRVLCAHYGIIGEKETDESQRELLEVLTVVPEAVLYDDAS